MWRVRYKGKLGVKEQARESKKSGEWLGELQCRARVSRKDLALSDKRSGYGDDKWVL